MKKIIAFVLASSPLLALAQGAPLTDINSVATRATNIGNLVIALAISLAVLWIIINVIRYLVVGGQEGRKEGGLRILYGVVALFVVLSIWGLVYILKNSFKTTDTTPTTAIQRAATLPKPADVQ